MKTIHKYIMPSPGTSVEIEVPYGAVFGRVEMFNGNICMWAEVSLDQQRRTLVEFTTMGTGWAVDDSFAWIGTVTDGPFVWHVYMRFL